MITSVRKLHPLFGAELTGVIANRALQPPEAAELVAAVEVHGLVLLRGQALEEDSFMSFAKSLGPIWDAFRPAAHDKHKSEKPHALTFSNRSNDGERLSLSDPAINYLKVNEFWHTDSTYTRPGATVSILAPQVLPAQGGNTEFCDTRVAYEGLSQSVQARINPMSAYHSLRASLGRAGLLEHPLFGKAVKRDAIRRPLVQRNARTGRFAILLASHIGAIDGLSEEQCGGLLVDLMREATTPNRIYSHTWQPGDILLWHNHCTMHRATPFDSQNSIRSMWSFRILDEADVV